MKERSDDDVDWEVWKKAAKKWLRASKALKEAKETIVELAQEKSCYGAGIKYLHAFKRGRVSYDKVPELKGVDLEPYRGPGFFTNTVSAI